MTARSRDAVCSTTDVAEAAFFEATVTLASVRCLIELTLSMISDVTSLCSCIALVSDENNAFKRVSKAIGAHA